MPSLHFDRVQKGRTPLFVCLFVTLYFFLLYPASISRIIYPYPFLLLYITSIFLSHLLNKCIPCILLFIPTYISFICKHYLYFLLKYLLYKIFYLVLNPQHDHFSCIQEMSPRLGLHASLL